MSYRLLIIDDDPRSVEALEFEVKPLHHEVTAVNDQESAFKLLEKNSYDYALVDIRLKAHPRDMNPDIEVGYATIKYLREHCPSMIIIAVTAFDETSEINTNAIKAGADDFWSKNPGGSGEKLLAKIRRLAPNSSLKPTDVSRIERNSNTQSSLEDTGQPTNMVDIGTRIKNFAPTDVTILLLGQPGTGKGYIAEEIHQQSNRKDKPFIVVNCPQLSKSNINSELFGHKRGSFTGSISDRKGLALSSDGGTLFFDEIGDMDLESQAVILRFIEQKEVKPFGSDEIKIVDVRIIAATNQPLESLMPEGRFRKDLYTRLSGVIINVPLLRERDSKEFEKIARHFYRRFREEHRHKKGFKDVRVKNSVWAELANYEYSWPGNVRELMHIINTTLLEVGGKNIRLEDFKDQIIRTSGS
ncbi:sigma-54-dependent Fis family transcriptional regulator [bacterium]|nr:sigma-54-dependent Fis family transcriptional regulator [bacterium]